MLFWASVCVCMCVCRCQSRQSADLQTQPASNSFCSTMKPNPIEHTRSVLEIWAIDPLKESEHGPNHCNRDASSETEKFSTTWYNMIEHCSHLLCIFHMFSICVFPSFFHHPNRSPGPQPVSIASCKALHHWRPLAQAEVARPRKRSSVSCDSPWSWRTWKETPGYSVFIPWFS